MGIGKIGKIFGRGDKMMKRSIIQDRQTLVLFFITEVRRLFAHF